VTAQTAARRRVQVDRRLAGALLRRAGGSRSMAAARAGVQADVAERAARDRAAVGDQPGAADERNRAARLRRAAVLLDGPA